LLQISHGTIGGWGFLRKKRHELKTDHESKESSKVCFLIGGKKQISGEKRGSRDKKKQKGGGGKIHDSKGSKKESFSDHKPALWLGGETLKGRVRRGAAFPGKKENGLIKRRGRRRRQFWELLFRNERGVVPGRTQ